MVRFWNVFSFAALVVVLAACSGGLEEDAGQSSREAEFRALVDDAFANPMSKEDNAKYDLDLENAANVNQLLVDHFYTASADERTTAEGDGYTYEGEAGLIFTEDAGDRVPLYRLNNPDNIDHFYTISADERDYAESIGYAKEGVAGYIYSPDAGDGAGRTPLHRFFNIRTSDHFYTIDENERNSLSGDQDWQYEGVAGYLPTEGAGATPLYRLVREVRPAPPCTGENLSDADEQALLDAVSDKLETEETVSPEELNSLSSRLTAEFGCDYGVNGLLMTQLGGSGVTNFNFAQFADTLEQQTADMNLSSEQQELLTTATDAFRQAGTQLISYDELSLNFDLGDLDENEAIVATRVKPTAGGGVSFNCGGSPVCVSPSGAVIIDIQGTPVEFSFSPDAVIIEVAADVFEGVPVIDTFAGFDLIWDESNPDANLFETITPDQVNLDAGASFCGTAACAGGELNLEIDQFDKGGLDIDPGFLDSILDPLT